MIPGAEDTLTWLERSGAAAWPKCPLGSAPARPLRPVSVRRAAPGSSALPGRGPATGIPATASQLREPAASKAADSTAFGHSGSPYVLLSNTGAKPYTAVYDKLTAPGSDFECRPDGAAIPPGRIYTAADAQVDFMPSGHLATPTPNPNPAPTPNPNPNPNPTPNRTPTLPPTVPQPYPYP
jgi:hypothetical protein